MTPTKPNEAEAVTEADVAAAERDAADAEALAASLEEAVRNGDDTVTPDAIVNQKNLGMFARLRAEATKRKLAKAKEAQRLAALAVIHDEIHEYGDSVGDELAKLLAACHDANNAYRAAVKAHNAKVAEWHQRAAVLGVPEGMSAPRPPAQHGRLAIRSDATVIRADMLKLDSVTVKSHEVDDLADRIATEPHNADTLIDHLRTHTAVQAAGKEAGLHYYRGSGGAVIGYDKPFTDADAKNRGLTKLSDQEVWA